MCQDCGQIYGTEQAIAHSLLQYIVTKLRNGKEAVSLPSTQEEWNALYPGVKEAVEKHNKENDEAWAKIYKDWNDEEEAHRKVCPRKDDPDWISHTEMCSWCRGEGPNKDIGKVLKFNK